MFLLSITSPGGFALIDHIFSKAGPELLKKLKSQISFLAIYKAIVKLVIADGECGIKAIKQDLAEKCNVDLLSLSCNIKPALVDRLTRTAREHARAIRASLAQGVVGFLIGGLFLIALWSNVIMFTNMLASSHNPGGTSAMKSLTGNPTKLSIVAAAKFGQLVEYPIEQNPAASKHTSAYTCFLCNPSTTPRTTVSYPWTPKSRSPAHTSYQSP